MSSRNLLFLIFRRYIKKTIPSALISLTIFSLIGILLIATSLPFKFQFAKDFAELPAEISTSVSQHGMTSLSHEEIQQKMESLSLDDVSLEYGVIVSLKCSDNGEELIVPYIGLTDNLLEKINVSDKNIILKVEGEPSQINVTNPNLNETLQVTINTAKSKELTKNSLFENIFWIMLNYNLFSQQQNPNLASFSFIGNLSYGFEIAEELQIESDMLGVFFYGFLEEKTIERLTIDEISNKIEQTEIDLFQELIINGFEQDFINIHSPARYLFETINKEIDEEITVIQCLSIPNLILVLLLVFTLEIGLLSLLKTNGYIFWSRGLSSAKLKFLFYSLELVADLLIGLLIFGLFSTFIYLFKLPNSLIISLLLTYGIVFISILLSKLVHFISINYQPMLKTEHEKGDKKEKLIIPQKIKILSIVLLIFAFLIQLFGTFESLFWFPVISGIKGIVFEVIISIVMLSNLLVIFFSTNDNYLKKESPPNLKTLTKRLFEDGLKRFRIQRFTITGLYALLIFLLLQSTTARIYTNTIQNNEPIFDIVLYFKSSEVYDGFNTSVVENLASEIPEIKNLCPYNAFGASIIGERRMENTNVFAFNASSYNDLDLMWEHFVGTKGCLYKENPFDNLNTKSILINEHLAEKIGARVGDKIIMNAPFFTVKDGNIISIRVENLEVIGIVDTLPMPSFTHETLPFAYVDFSLLEQFTNEQNLNSKSLYFGFNLNLTIDELISEQEKQNQILNLILDQLNISSSMDYSVIVKDNKEIVNVFQAETEAQTFFIYFEIGFVLFLLPITTLVLSRRLIESINPSLVRLGARGYSDKEMRMTYTKEIFSSFTSSIIIGLLVGLITCLIYFRYDYPRLFIATNSQLLLSIIALLVIVLFGGIVSLGSVLLISVRQIKTINNKGKEKYEIYNH